MPFPRHGKGKATGNWATGEFIVKRTNLRPMNAGTLLLILIVLLLVGALPSWPYSSGWGYYPSGGLGLVLVIVLLLVLLKKV